MRFCSTKTKQKYLRKHEEQNYILFAHKNTVTYALPNMKKVVFNFTTAVCWPAVLPVQYT